MPPVNDEQANNLSVLRAVAGVLVITLLVIGAGLYFGWELPPARMRTYYTSATGYAPPPRAGVIPPGTVARGALDLAPSTEAAAEGLTNPLAGDPAAGVLGKKAYTVNCAMCHGEPGGAIGPVGEVYRPQPPPLAEHLPEHSDGRLYAMITYGIRSTPTRETAQYLPREWHAFEGITSARERWAIIAYLRSAFGAERRTR